MTRAEPRPEEGQAMTSSALRRPIRQFDRPHSQPPPEFPCGATQRDGKSPQNARQSGEYRLRGLTRQFPPSSETPNAHHHSYNLDHPPAWWRWLRVQPLWIWRRDRYWRRSPNNPSFVLVLRL